MRKIALCAFFKEFEISRTFLRAKQVEEKGGKFKYLQKSITRQLL